MCWFVSGAEFAIFRCRDPHVAQGMMLFVYAQDVGTFSFFFQAETVVVVDNTKHGMRVRA